MVKKKSMENNLSLNYTQNPCERLRSIVLASDNKKKQKHKNRKKTDKHLGFEMVDWFRLLLKVFVFLYDDNCSKTTQKSKIEILSTIIPIPLSFVCVVKWQSA